jgi:hypothetical protein
VPDNNNHLPKVTSRSSCAAGGCAPRTRGPAQLARLARLFRLSNPLGASDNRDRYDLRVSCYAASNSCRARHYTGFSYYFVPASVVSRQSWIAPREGP